MAIVMIKAGPAGYLLSLWHQVKWPGWHISSASLSVRAGIKQLVPGCGVWGGGVWRGSRRYSLVAVRRPSIYVLSKN